MELLKKLSGGKDLSEEEAESAMEGMISGSFTPAQTAGLLLALKMKGETDEEIAAFAKVMRKHAVRIHPDAAGLVDTCGTGGDGTHTYNVSTAAALVACGAGVRVAKHGNKSVSGKSGSSEVLEALGAKILQPAQAQECIERTGFGFMFAPYFHPAMKNVAGVRKELGVRTVFNLLGPLTNPAGAQSQLLGVFDAAFVPKIARVLSLLGTRHALVVHSEGMDEIGLGSTQVFEVRDGAVSSYVLDAAKFGIARQEIPKAHSPQESAKIIVDILEGEKGAASDVALLNAAGAIYVSGKAGSLEEGLAAAKEAVDSGQAREKLERIREFSGA